MSTLLCGEPLNVYVLLGFVPDSGWQWHTVRQHNFLFLWSSVLKEIVQISRAFCLNGVVYSSRILFTACNNYIPDFVKKKKRWSVTFITFNNMQFIVLVQQHAGTHMDICGAVGRLKRYFDGLHMVCVDLFELYTASTRGFLWSPDFEAWLQSICLQSTL